jgi:hypothetical protein
MTGLRVDAVKLLDKKLKCLSIRDFTQALASTLYEGGEVVIYKGKDPYRYLNIRPIKVVKGEGGGLSEEEYKERLQEALNEGEEKEVAI